MTSAARSPSVRAARPEETGRIARVLAEAFRDDPVISWITRSDERRDWARTAFFEGWTREQIEAGRRTQVAELGGEIAAGALWTDPPGAQPSPRLGLMRGLWGMRELTSRRRFPRFYRLVSSTEARYPRFDHYYLGAIGAADGARGSGVGAALLRATLDECDARGMPAYLESSNARNLSFYWRHGFRIIEELRLGRGAPSLWLMLREPPAQT
jgi:ribosomal protein S18 acetylase RimI-like enzyme